MSCLDKLFAIREQWLNHYLNVVYYAGPPGWATLLPTDMELSAQFTTEPSVCVSTPTYVSVNAYLQPKADFISNIPDGSLLVTSMFYQSHQDHNVYQLNFKYWYYDGSGWISDNRVFWP